MLMNDLSKERYISLLSDTSQEITTDEMRSAYKSFVIKIKAQNQPDEKYTTIYRMLNQTRIELVSLQLHIQYEQEGNVLKDLWLQKIIAFLDSELILFDKIFAFPELFIKKLCQWTKQ